MARKNLKKTSHKPAARAHHSDQSENMDDIQVSITRALLGIIAISIFIGFFLSPFGL